MRQACAGGVSKMLQRRVYAAGSASVVPPRESLMPRATRVSPDRTAARAWSRPGRARRSPRDLTVRRATSGCRRSRPGCCAPPPRIWRRIVGPAIDGPHQGGQCHSEHTLTITRASVAHPGDRRWQLRRPTRRRPSTSCWSTQEPGRCDAGCPATSGRRAWPAALGRPSTVDRHMVGDNHVFGSGDRTKKRKDLICVGTDRAGRACTRTSVRTAHPGTLGWPRTCRTRNSLDEELKSSRTKNGKDLITINIDQQRFCTCPVRVGYVDRTLDPPNRRGA